MSGDFDAMRFDTILPAPHAGRGVGWWTDQGLDLRGYRIERIHVMPYRATRGANTKAPQRWDVFAPPLTRLHTERFIGTEPSRWRAMRLADLHYFAERNFHQTA